MKLSSRQWNLDGWTDVGQGWTGREDTLRLMGWSKERRVVVIRRARRIDIEDAGKTKVKRRGRKSNPHKQAELALIDQNEATKNWEYAALVCDMPYTGRCKRREFRPVGVGRDRRHHGQCARQRADLRPGQEQADRWSRSLHRALRPRQRRGHGRPHVDRVTGDRWLGFGHVDVDREPDGIELQRSSYRERWWQCARWWTGRRHPDRRKWLGHLRRRQPRAIAWSRPTSTHPPLARTRSASSCRATCLEAISSATESTLRARPTSPATDWTTCCRPAPATTPSTAWAVPTRSAPDRLGQRSRSTCR